MLAKSLYFITASFLNTFIYHSFNRFHSSSALFKALMRVVGYFQIKIRKNDNDFF